MPVNESSAEYQSWAPQWQRIRDCVAGAHVVHKAGTNYLPRLEGMSDEEYDAYINRAYFFGATARTVDALSGLIFRKPPVIELPDAMKYMLNNATLSGITLQAVAEQIVEDIVQISRAGILVDFPQNDLAQRSQADADAMGLRPSIHHYSAENIIDWRIQTIGTRAVVTQVRLLETISEPVDEFTNTEVDQVRVLELVEGNYQVRLFRDDNGWYEYSRSTPLMNGRPIQYIPFVFISTRDTSPSIQKPLMTDLADLNLSHYMVSADLHHGAHFTALPTAVLTGHELDQGKSLRIGSSEAWVIRNEQAKAYFLEFSGTGLATLTEMLKAKEQQMAALGARLLAPEKASAEAVGTLQIRRQGETSMLSSIAQAVSDAITIALMIARDWAGVPGDVSIELNRDFMPIAMDAQTITALLAAVQSGEISKQTFFENMQRGEIIDADKSFDDEQQEIADNLPPMPQPSPALA